MKYKIFQIHLTDEEVDKINQFESHLVVAKQVVRMKLLSVDKVAEKAKEALAENFYDHVANIEAEGLESVFEIGNVGPEENIERFGPMSSISVGDVIEDEEENKFAVAMFGFEQL